MTVIDRAARAMGVLGAVLLMATMALGLLVVPADRYQGDAQRLLYPHVAAAWTAYLCFGLVALGSLGYLITRSLRWDRLAVASAEVGVGLTALTLVLGSLWAKPVWGTYWTWDPRLVTTAVLLLVYLGYLGIRDLSGDLAVNARRAAVLGLLALVTVPVVHFSTVWWRTLHQPPGVLRPGGPQGSMPTEMLAMLLLAVVAFTLSALGVIHARTRLLEDRQRTRSAAEDTPPPVTRVEARATTLGGPR